MLYEATYCGILTVTSDDPDEVFQPEKAIEVAVDSMSEELLKLDNIIDPVIGGSLGSGDLRITLATMADDPVTALKYIDASLRSAFLAAEVGTPNWPAVDFDQVAFSKIRVVPDESAVDADNGLVGI